MNDIVLRNRHFGPEAALQLVEERAPHGFEQIDDVVSRRDVQNIVEVFSSAAPLDPAIPSGMFNRGWVLALTCEPCRRSRL
jgi:hypothetical protein